MASRERGARVVEAVISVTDLHKSYKNLRAVNGVSLEVRGGEAYGLFGPNGSGKSTALHALVDIVRPTGGTTTICGFDSRSPEAKRLLVLVPDELGMPETLSGGEFLDFVRSLYGVRDRSRAEVLVRVLGLEGALGRLIDEYSHGMKKKLRVVAALLHGPRVLVLDEPFGGLDPEAVINLKRLISSEKEKGTAVFVATHDLLAAQHYCDRIGILSDGMLVAEGTTDQLFERFGSDSLEEVFLKASKLLDRSREVETYLQHL
jgi:ABC-2 type transport system ATP-binding protein